MTADEFDQVMCAVVAAWPHSKLLADTVELGETLLIGMDGRLVMAAVASLALDGREHAPPMGLIAKRAAELHNEAHGDRLPDGEEALREVYRTISRCGIYRTPEWSNPAIATAVEAMGGWEAVCNDDNPEAFRAHFLKLYGTVQDRTRREALMAPVMRELLGALNLKADRELTP